MGGSCSCLLHTILAASSSLGLLLQREAGRGPLEASSLSFPLQNTVRNLTKINCSKQNFQHVPLLGSFTGFLQQNRSGILFFLCYSLTLVSVPRGLLYLELLLAHFLWCSLGTWDYRDQALPRSLSNCLLITILGWKLWKEVPVKNLGT